MTSKRSHVIRRILFVINIIVIVAYLLTCLIPFVDPSKFWFISFLGLGFPIIAFTLLAFVLIWIIYKSKWAWLSILVLVIGYKQLNAAFAFHLAGEFTKTKSPKTIRILQYNVMGEEIIRQLKISGNKSTVAKTLSFIKKSNADVLTLQEFYSRFDKEPSLVSIIDSLGYPYHYLAESERTNKKKYVGVAIFSKFPLKNTTTIPLDSYPDQEFLIFGDINVDGKNFRIFTAHLQSIGIDRSDYKSIHGTDYGQSTEMKVDKSIAGKLKRAYQWRFDQAKIIREKVNESPYPVILCADFNDVPNSRTYFTIKGNMQDAFLKKGSFVGRTFRYISPTLRIDYILSDPIFKVTQYSVPHVKFSDHFPVITDLQYQ